jgi:hypothetical protein
VSSGVSTTIPTLTNEQLTAALLNLSFGVTAQGNAIEALRTEFREFRALLTGSPPPPITAPTTLALPSLTEPLLTGGATHSLAPPSSGVPLHLLSFPPSPSQLPPWLLGSTTALSASMATPSAEMTWPR